ncbi:unnamed protein product [Dicrocoelium dendriticum]|nr:unnamed protein product [Dicrocoelium dendriticum]
MNTQTVCKKLCLWYAYASIGILTVLCIAERSRVRHNFISEVPDFTWSYKPEGSKGPASWGLERVDKRVDADWSLCRYGKRQSPIDIQTNSLIFDHSLEAIAISGKDNQLDLIVENIGQDIQLSILSDDVILTGGPVSYSYHVFSIRIKFGSVSTRGSDHRIDGIALPGELQIYAFNSELYQTYTQAATRPHGLAAISVFFKLGNITNKDLLGIVAAAEKTVFRGQRFHLKGIELHSLLSSTLEYMTYDGSLPFPGCHETVTWIILNHPISISETELKTLRRIQVNQTLWSGAMADNFRPVQPINNRSVRTNINFDSLDQHCTVKKQASYSINMPKVTGYNEKRQPGLP